MFFLILQLFINFGFLLFLLFMVLSIVKGAPYVRSKREAIAAMVELSEFSEHDTILDFGAGDGEVVLAFAKAGAHHVRGVEINLFLVLVANVRILLAGKWKYARVYWANMWWLDTSPYSIVVVYGFPNIMKDLEEKLITESKSTRKILSNSFIFPNLKRIRKELLVALYQTD